MGLLSFYLRVMLTQTINWKRGLRCPNIKKFASWHIQWNAEMRTSSDFGQTIMVRLSNRSDFGRRLKSQRPSSNTKLHCFTYIYFFFYLKWSSLAQRPKTKWFCLVFCTSMLRVYVWKWNNFFFGFRSFEFRHSTVF